MGDVDGLVVGKLSYLGDQDKYIVRYLDEAGPQERMYPVSMLNFDGREAEGNVVVMGTRRVA
ncbi:hypothetical protein LB521_27950 [Mesorhizobium sp. BR-1-1-8]|uniref:hypothetical protein n=1 Tax=unclassified Mesorhizobium TaxID=325217 RepID=UPI001CCCB452|nr:MULTISPECIES: hypothetical protein [unclassified Mesorhizobium]MBZ9973472.1 hypothetical protein [Mesorhizobium sp. BR1-1-12]MBZ9984972.1 hypothetical protein [Mesorhizobium sp. BR-1-1-8]